MPATAATAPARAAPASRTAATGYSSSLLASNSAVHRRLLRQPSLDFGAARRAAAHRVGQGRRHVPCPAAPARARGEVGIRAVRLAVRAPAARPAAPARLLGQRPCQHVLHVAEPLRQRPPPRPQLPPPPPPPLALLPIPPPHPSPLPPPQ